MKQCSHRCSEIRAAVVHLLMPRGEIACGDGPGMLAPQADINLVTCPECIEHHDSLEETREEGGHRDGVHPTFRIV